MSATSTSQNAARSARRWPGALEFWASWTSLTICASAVSAPTAVARARSVPFLLMVAPMSRSPARFLTGRLSPVTVDSSTWLSPSSTAGVDRHLRAGADRAARRRRRPRRSGPRRARRLAGPPPWAGRDRAARGSRRWRRRGRASRTSGPSSTNVASIAGGLVEDLALDEERRRDRVQPAGADGDRDQHHHVQRPGAQRGDGAGEEDRRRVEDHRQAEQQLPDVAVHAERRRQLPAEQLRPDHRPQRRSGP